MRLATPIGDRSQESSTGRVPMKSETRVAGNGGAGEAEPQYRLRPRPGASRATQTVPDPGVGVQVQRVVCGNAAFARLRCSLRSMVGRDESGMTCDYICFECVCIWLEKDAKIVRFRWHDLRKQSPTPT